jgi:WD40 repeat protein
MLTNSESASGNLRSNQLILDASIDSLSAGDSLKNNLLLTLFPSKEDEKSQVIRTLRKAVYTVREYNRQEGFPSGVQSVFWKENRLLVVSAENDGTVRVLDKQTKKLAELARDRSKVTRVIFSPNGSQLAIGTRKGQILLWDWQNQQRATVLQNDRCKETKNISSANSCAITSLSFDRHGSQLVSVGANGIARQWHLSNHQYQEFKVPHHKIITAGFHTNGQLLLVTKTPDGKTLSVFNSSFQQLSKTKQFPASIDIAILSPQGEEIVITYGSANTVGSQGYLWHWRNQNNSQGDKLSVRPDNISFSLDGRQLATTEFNNGTIRLLDLKTNNITELKGHRGQIANLNFRSNGRVLATVSADGTLRLWALTQQQIGQSQELPDKVKSLTFSRDGQRIATQAGDGTVRLLDLSGKLVQQFHHPYPVFKSLSFSPNGEQLATLSNKGTAGILNLSSQQYREFTGKYDGSNLSFSPNGQQLAVTGNNDRRKKVYVLNVSPGQPNEKPFPYPETISINNVIWRSDDKILLAGVQQRSRASKSVVLLDVKLGTQLQTITEQLGVGAFSGIGANSDGSLAAFVQEDGSVSLWYLDGTKMGEVRDPDRKINSVILSPDSSMLATIGEDGTTKLWEIGKLDKLLVKSCDRVRDYLKDNLNNVEERNRHLCDNVPKLTEKISVSNQ